MVELGADVLITAGASDASGDVSASCTPRTTKHFKKTGNKQALCKVEDASKNEASCYVAVTVTGALQRCFPRRRVAALSFCVDLCWCGRLPAHQHVHADRYQATCTHGVD